MSSSNTAGVKRRGAGNLMTLPTCGSPQGESCGHVGCKRQEAAGCWRRRYQEDEGELQNVACEESAEHHPGGLHARPHVASSFRTPRQYGSSPAPEPTTYKNVGYERPETATPRSRPKEKQPTLRRSAQPDRGDGQSRCEGDEDGGDDRQFEQVAQDAAQHP